jgi:hypothetical protein
LCRSTYREDSRVSIGKNSEVIALHVEERQDDVFPAIAAQKTTISLPAIAVDSEAGVNDIEEDVIEKSLESGDRGSLIDKQGSERVRGSDAEG